MKDGKGAKDAKGGKDKKGAAGAAGAKKKAAPSAAKIALKKTFEKIDEDFFTELGDEHNVCGSCGLLCLVEDACVWAANSGDSRAIVVQRGERGAVHGVPLTTDLNTSCIPECAKVAARSTDKEAVRYNERDLIGHRRENATMRVAGSLMVTRALGDGYLKRKNLSMPPFQEHVPYITVKPKVTKIELHSSHAFLVIASDGIWDHLSNDEAAIEIDRAARAQEEERQKAPAKSNAANPKAAATTAKESSTKKEKNAKESTPKDKADKKEEAQKGLQDTENKEDAQKALQDTKGLQDTTLAMCLIQAVLAKIAQKNCNFVCVFVYLFWSFWLVSCEAGSLGLVSCEAGGR